MAVTVVALAVGAVLVWRAWHVRAMEALSARRRPLGKNGIVIGGDSFELKHEGAPAVLLVHGAGDTPQTLRYLGDALHARGFHVCAPLLPGHGRTIHDFRRVSAPVLIDAAIASYDSLRASHDWVGVIGLSMGGALAVHVAAARPGLPALGLVAPYLAMPPHIERAAALAPLWGMIAPVVRSSEGKSVLDEAEAEKNLAYGVFTAVALRALRDVARSAAQHLPRVTAPTVMIQSREDNRISVADGERAFALLGAPIKELEWVTGAAHIITVDFGRDAVIAKLAAFMETHAPPRALPSASPM